MAATGAGLFWAASYSPLGTRIPRTTAQLQPKAASVSAGQSVATSTVQSSTTTTTTTSTGSNNGRLEKSSSGATQEVKQYDSVAKSEAESSSSSSFTLKDYYEQSIGMTRSNDGGPPRWFSPLESGARSDDSPLLLFLPGW